MWGLIQIRAQTLLSPFLSVLHSYRRNLFKGIHGGDDVNIRKWCRD